MRFEGFGDGAVEFYEGLEADNSKAYWNDQKAVYQQHVREPMEALLSELAAEFAPAVDSEAANGRAKVFRPHRDVRFSRDKSPYKTHCGGVIEAGRGGGACYVEVSADGMLVAGGCFHTEPDQLARFRTAVDEQVHGERLREIVDGQRSVSPDTALRLERYFGSDAQGWLNLQSAYDLRRAEKAAGRIIKRDIRPLALAA